MVKNKDEFEGIDERFYGGYARRVEQYANRKAEKLISKEINKAVEDLKYRATDERRGLVGDINGNSRDLNCEAFKSAVKELSNLQTKYDRAFKGYYVNSDDREEVCEICSNHSEEFIKGYKRAKFDKYEDEKLEYCESLELICKTCEEYVPKDAIVQG